MCLPQQAYPKGKWANWLLIKTKSHMFPILLKIKKKMEQKKKKRSSFFVYFFKRKPLKTKLFFPRFTKIVQVIDWQHNDLLRSMSCDLRDIKILMLRSLFSFKNGIETCFSRHRHFTLVLPLTLLALLHG